MNSAEITIGERLSVLDPVELEAYLACNEEQPYDEYTLNRALAKLDSYDKSKDDKDNNDSNDDSNASNEEQSTEILPFKLLDNVRDEMGDAFKKLNTPLNNMVEKRKELTETKNALQAKLVKRQDDVNKLLEVQAQSKKVVIDHDSDSDSDCSHFGYNGPSHWRMPKTNNITYDDMIKNAIEKNKDTILRNDELKREEINNQPQIAHKLLPTLLIHESILLYIEEHLKMYRKTTDANVPKYNQLQVKLDQYRIFTNAHDYMYEHLHEAHAQFAELTQLYREIKLEYMKLRNQIDKQLYENVAYVIVLNYINDMLIDYTVCSSKIADYQWNKWHHKFSLIDITCDNYDKTLLTQAALSKLDIGEPIIRKYIFNVANEVDYVQGVLREHLYCEFVPSVTPVQTIKIVPETSLQSQPINADKTLEDPWYHEGKFDTERRLLADIYEMINNLESTTTTETIMDILRKCLQSRDVDFIPAFIESYTGSASMIEEYAVKSPKLAYLMSDLTRTVLTIIPPHVKNRMQEIVKMQCES